MAQFGPKHWYKDTPLLATKLKSQSDRRKFRQGLKGDVEFVNYLNVQDLRTLLDSGDPDALKLLNLDENVKPSDLFSALKNVPLVKILSLWNEDKAVELLGLVDKIEQALHFSLSLTDYFAYDDALEPALAVVCESLRKEPSIGCQLMKLNSSFLSLAQCYQKQRSGADMDFAPQRTPKSSRAVQPPQMSFKRAPRPPPYQYGLCFDFQKNNCFRQNCKYNHLCSKCGAHQHGSSQCRGG